jgi:hypothetical protein
MRRHWQLVCCAFSFCWYHHAHAPASEPLTVPVQRAPADKHEPEEAAAEPRVEEKKGARSVQTTAGVLAQSLASRQSLARTLGLAPAVLAGVVATAPTSASPTAL